MSVLSDLTIEIGLDDSGVEEGAKSVKDKVRGLSKSLGNLGKGLTAGVTLPIAAGFAFAIGQASDLNEATSAVATTYGDASTSIIKASENSVDSAMLSQASYLSAAAQIGVFGKMAGKTGDELTEFGTSSIQAAADLSSFWNVPVPEALAAIQAGLRGEYEPLSRFGVLLDDATLQQYALEQGIWNGVDAMTEAQKVEARQKYITENLGAAQGDAARTADSFANQMRKLKERSKDVAASFGKLLLPYMLSFTKYAQKLVKYIQGMSDTQKKWALAFLAVAAAIGPVLIGLSMMLPALLVLTGPIGLIVLALAALGTAYALNLFGFRDAVNGTAVALWNILKPIVAFGAALIEVFRSGDPVKKQLEAFPGILQPIVKPFLMIADAIGDLVAAYRSGGLENLLKVLPDKLKQIAKAFFDLHKAVLDLFLKGLKAAWPYVLAFIKKIPGWLKDAMVAAAEWLVPAGIRVIAGLAQGMRDRWPAFKEWFNQRRDLIRDVFANALSLLLHKGEEIIKGLMEGAKAIWGGAGQKGTLADWFAKLPGNIMNFIENAIGGIKTRLTDAGASILTYLKNGAASLWSDVGGVGALWVFINGLPSKIAATLANAVANSIQTVKDAGAAIIQAFWDGMREVWDRIPNIFKGLAAKAGYSLNVTQPSAYGSTSFTPTGGAMTGGTMVTNNITINGYNRDPNELARILARDIALTIGAT